MTTHWDKLYVVKKHQTQMLVDRGYDVSWTDAFGTHMSGEALLSFSQKEFKKYYTKLIGENDHSHVFEHLSGVFSHPVTEDTLLVWYVPPQSKDVSVEDIRTLSAVMNERKVTHSILVSEQKLGAKAALEISGLVKFDIEHFKYDDLSYNPTQHIFVPKHIRLSKEEAQNFLSANKIQRNQLPQMYDTDKQALWFHFVVGDIIFIPQETLISLSAPRVANYRLVIKAPPK